MVLAAGMIDKRRGTSDEQIQANPVEAVEKARKAAPAGANFVGIRDMTVDVNSTCARVDAGESPPRRGARRRGSVRR